MPSEELARFTEQLGDRHAWYSHIFVNVLAVTTPLPTGAVHGNQRIYRERDWCYFGQFRDFKLNASGMKYINFTTATLVGVTKRLSSWWK